MRSKPDSNAYAYTYAHNFTNSYPNSDAHAYPYPHADARAIT
jgi:hypothetical protein